MRVPLVVAALLALGSPTLLAQQPGRPRARPDSLAAVRTDSVAADSTAVLVVPFRLPTLSVLGDLVADLSPEGSTQLDDSRFGVREVELALQASVDAYFRADVFLAFSDLDVAAVRQATLSTTVLPWRLQASLGRFPLPFGKENPLHRHDLHTIDYPYVIRRFLGEDGGRGTGARVSRVFTRFGVQEIVLAVADGLTPTDQLLAIDEPNRLLGGLGYLGRLRSSWQLTRSTGLELSLSGMTGRRLQPLIGSVVTDVGTVNAVVARQSTLGADLTVHWRPSLGRGVLLQGELMHQLNEDEEALRPRIPLNPATGGPFYGGPVGDFTGGYLYARGQLTRRLFLGARGDRLEDPLDLDGAILTAGSGYLEFFLSDFSRLLAAYQRRSVAGIGENLVLLQATFALGPHRPIRY